MRKQLVFVSVILLPFNALSQESSEYLKTKALSFSFNGLNLSGFNGGIGGKSWSSNETAWTLLLSANINSQKNDATSVLTEGSNSQTSAQIQIGIESHNFITNNFSPYIAGSIFFGLNIQRDKFSVNVE